MRSEPVTAMARSLPAAHVLYRGAYDQKREIVECAMRMSSEGRLTLPGPASEKLV